MFRQDDLLTQPAGRLFHFPPVADIYQFPTAVIKIRIKGFVVFAKLVSPTVNLHLMDMRQRFQVFHSLIYFVSQGTCGGHQLGTHDVTAAKAIQSFYGNEEFFPGRCLGRQKSLSVPIEGMMLLAVDINDAFVIYYDIENDGLSRHFSRNLYFFAKPAYRVHTPGVIRICRFPFGIIQIGHLAIRNIIEMKFPSTQWEGIDWLNILELHQFFVPLRFHTAVERNQNPQN